MTRRHPAFAAALLLLLAALPAAAQAPDSCELVTEGAEMMVLAEPPQTARTEYWITLRNPHSWPAAIRIGIDLPGIIPAPAEPVVVPAGQAAPVLVGWFPHDMSRGRMAPPVAEAVREAMTMPACRLLRPGPVSRDAAPSAGGAVPARGLQVIRDEGAQDIRQGF